MKFLPYFIGASMTLAAAACGDTEDVGSTLTEDEVAIVIDSTFTLTGHSVQVNAIQSRTSTQLLGAINADGFGKFTSDFVCQFMAAGAIDTTGITSANIDSLQLVMAIPLGGYVGDSIAPMGLTVYELPQGAQLPSPIYSDFEPRKEFPDMKPIASRVYACNAITPLDEALNKNYRYVITNLPVELGRRLYDAYIQDPASYLEPASFARVFPGLYVTNSYGSGRVVKIDGTSMRMYYHLDTKDASGRDTTIVKTGTYYAVTPEVITNNNISYSMSEQLDQMYKQGDALLVAPTGMEVQIQFPLLEILRRYRDNPGALTVPNALTLTIPAEHIPNNYGITPPPNLLMVLSDRQEQFFQNNEVVDNIHSFYASYDNSKHCYTFTAMRDYLVEMLGKEEITPAEYTFTLVPVSVTTENYSGTGAVFISSITPYIATPAMARLNLDKAKIKFTYSKQSLK